MFYSAESSANQLITWPYSWRSAKHKYKNMFQFQKKNGNSVKLNLGLRMRFRWGDLPYSGNSARLKLAYWNWPDQSEVLSFTSAISSASRIFYSTKPAAWWCNCAKCQSESVHHKLMQHSNRVHWQLGNNRSTGHVGHRLGKMSLNTESTACMSIHALKLNPLHSFASDLRNPNDWSSSPRLSAQHCTSLFPFFKLIRLSHMLQVLGLGLGWC